MSLVITTTFGTSHGPTHPLMVNWTRFNNPRFRHSVFSHSTGTSGKTTLGIAAATAFADRNLPDHEPLGFQRTIPIVVHKMRSILACKSHSVQYAVEII